MPLKGMASVKKQLGKLLAATPSHKQGKGWLLLWRFDDLVTFVREAMPSNAGLSSADATLFVCQKEAERLGIVNDPALIAALGELHDAIAALANAPSPGCAGGAKEWEQRNRAEDAVHSACGRAASIILGAWGAPPGPLGPHPPGGRPREPVEVPPEWFGEPKTAAE
jgi:hypothetical protein